MLTSDGRRSVLDHGTVMMMPCSQNWMCLQRNRGPCAALIVYSPTRNKPKNAKSNAHLLRASMKDDAGERSTIERMEEMERACLGLLCVNWP